MIVYVFTFFFGSSSTEIDDMIRKSTNLLLTRTLSHCLQYAIKKKNVGLAEVRYCILCFKGGRHDGYPETDILLIHNKLKKAVKKECDEFLYAGCCFLGTLYLILNCNGACSWLLF